MPNCLPKQCRGGTLEDKEGYITLNRELSALTCVLYKGDEVQVHILLRGWGRGVTLRASSLQGKAKDKVCHKEQVLLGKEI
jgi:hypothetical protein